MQAPASRPRSPVVHDRDRVAALVEEQLRELARSEGTQFVTAEDEKGTMEVRYNGLAARGETLDIAILRLANSLLDDHRYTARITGALARLGGLLVEQNSPGRKEMLSPSSPALNSSS